MAVAGYDTTQVANAAVIADVAHAYGLGERGALLGVMCAMGESSLRNIDYGDWETNGVRNPDGTPTSSIGLFQQQSWWGTPAERMDPRYAAWAFFDRLAKVTGWASLAPTIAIHRVQVNADPNHYARYETPARTVLAWVTEQRKRGAYMASSFDIIEVPWQPGTFGRRVLIELVAKALGKPAINSMLRLYAAQKEAWDNSPVMGGRGAPADNPDDPSSYELGHVRGVAVDIDATAENVRRLLAVGLVRPFSYEPWHFRVPGNVRVWPLITAIPATAYLKATPIKETEVMDDMSIVIKREKTGQTFTVAPGNYIKVHPGPTDREQKLALYSYQQDTPRGYNEADLSVALWDFGFPELGGDLGRLPNEEYPYVWAKRGAI